MYNKIQIILGPPGTGKTTSLLQIMERELERGTKPYEVAFVSFTKKATEEAAERAMTKFNLKRDQLPWFRTLHSMAFRCLGMNRNEVMTPPHYKAVGDSVNVPTSGYSNMDDEDTTFGMQEGDIMIFLLNLARLREQSLAQVFNQCCLDDRIELEELDQFSRALSAYKSAKYLSDYTDMIERFVGRADAGEREAYMPRLKVLIVDEAQDLSRLQWRMVRKLHDVAERVYIAGDDDQAIYDWAGSCLQTFLKVGESAARKTILNKSYRLPRTVFNLSQKIIGNVTTRFDKDWKPRSEEGSVQRYLDISEVNMSEGKWLVLVRNNFFIKQITEHLESIGLLYETRKWSPVTCPDIAAIRHWERLRSGANLSLDDVKVIYARLQSGVELAKGAKQKLNTVGRADRLYNMQELKKNFGLLTSKVWFESLLVLPVERREYFRNVLKQGTPLNQHPRIRISTIHGAKGGEEENVVILTDLSPRTDHVYNESPDGEHRTFYVAVTRARERVHIIQSTGERYYRELVD